MRILRFISFLFEYSKKWTISFITLKETFCKWNKEIKRIHVEEVVFGLRMLFSVEPSSLCYVSPQSPAIILLLEEVLISGILSFSHSSNHHHPLDSYIIDEAIVTQQYQQYCENMSALFNSKMCIFQLGLAPMAHRRPYVVSFWPVPKCNSIALN